MAGGSYLRNPRGIYSEVSQDGGRVHRGGHCQVSREAGADDRGDVILGHEAM
jgi:hypothetical protein